MRAGAGIHVGALSNILVDFWSSFLKIDVPKSRKHDRKHRHFDPWSVTYVIRTTVSVWDP